MNTARRNVTPEAEGPPTRREAPSRSRRKRPVRALTVSVKRLSKRELAIGRALFPPGEHADVARPRARADCADGIRPCPFVSCVHHLYLDVHAETGAIKLNFPDIAPDELESMPESCALDVADRQGATLEEVGAIMNLTRERIRQVEVQGLAKLQATRQMRELRDVEGSTRDPSTRRRLPVLHTDDDDDAAGACVADEDFDVEAFAGEDLD